MARTDISWISLGHATDAEIKALLHPATGPRITFADIFEVAAPVAGVCTDPTFKAVRGANSDTLECLKLKPGKELAASRLETRRYAALLGATTEINKEEGSAYDPTRNTLYIALSDVTIGMLAPTGGFGADHINVKSNRCGGVWALDVGPSTTATGEVISDYAPLNWRPVLVGSETTYPADSPYFGNSCSINGLASPDNLTFLPGYDLLVIGEDTSRHQNDAIWSYHVVTGKLTRIMTTPYGSETTSPYWYPNLGGFGYLMSVVQHPYGESDQARISDTESTGPESWVGVIGPFPALD